MTAPIAGHCAARFAPVKEAFERNFDEGGEVGARVAVIERGETVVDLWGGHADEARQNAWQEDTLVCSMSVSKGVVALCAHLLASRGLLDYDQPVAAYWPEFAAAGKERITVRQAIRLGRSPSRARARAASTASRSWPSMRHTSHP